MSTLSQLAANGVPQFSDYMPLNHGSPMGISTAPIAGLRGFEQTFVPHGATLVTQGAQTEHIFYILSGWALEEELTADGDIAWADIMMRGEVAGLNCVMLERAAKGHHQISTATIQALTDVFAVRVPRHKISQSLDQDHAFSKMAHETLRRQTAHLHSHLVALSAKSAHERVIMLLRSLRQRARQANILTTNQRLPISQVILARVANVSVVHMNRIVQKLRLDGLLDWTADGVLLKMDSGDID
jgi:CRP/FNR family transcriptional regulator, anaerobic regulatory protein